MVPQSTYLFDGRRSIRYKKEIEHLPTEAIPNKKMKNVVTSISVEMKNPMNATIYSPIEAMNIFFLPYRSDRRGMNVAAKAHPMNILDPMNPILCLVTHFKSRVSNQLCREVSSSQFTLVCRVVSQKFTNPFVGQGVHGNGSEKSPVFEHMYLGCSSRKCNS